MYFPYLYGRQAELNAVRDLVDSFGAPQQIFPIIEPVGTADKLLGTLAELETRRLAACIVVNPHLGDFEEASSRDTWFDNMAPMIANPSVVIPIFKEQKHTTITDIANFVDLYPQRRIGIILCTDRIPPEILFTTLQEANCIVFLHPDVNPSSYHIGSLMNKLVQISENFKPKDRNKDYSGDEWLGDNHRTWIDNGYAGFSDFTVLPSIFKTGGGPVGAIALHLSYEDNNNIRVQHFVSATNDQKMPQAVKFHEALTDVSHQIALTPNRFHYSPGLKMYQSQHSNGQYTNLSGSKRQQIAHHIFTISKSLGC
ncbi:sce7725 family protein [Glutamicibacter sp. Je.9.36]|uniref:sce7725 family protein n=1 Tax=Glutamicibacter sp. Je.9.36 TaxID=3142837 RepID=UPI003DA8B09D